ETATMEWSELDIEASRWTIPKEKTKTKASHIVPLSPLVVQIITAQQKRGRYVFTTRQDKAISGLSKAKVELDALIATKSAVPVPHWTYHDLRRTAATTMAEELTIPPHVVEKILNHQLPSKVARIYNRAEYLSERKEALCGWADYIQRLVK